jgi:hypothetical protein
LFVAPLYCYLCHIVARAATIFGARNLFRFDLHPSGAANLFTLIPLCEVKRTELRAPAVAAPPRAAFA